MLNVLLNLPSKRITKHYSTNFTCLDCPVGGNCTVSIRSKINFCGYKTNRQKVSLLLCPRDFCCTGSQCSTIRSSNRNRVRTLCGSCIESYVERFLSSECISVDSCQNFPKFWLLYCFYALILATISYYLKGFSTLIKTTGRNSSKIFKSFKKKKKNDDEIDIMVCITGAEEDLEKTSHFTVSGISTLIVSFYQIKHLMKVDVHCNNSTDFSFITFIADCWKSWNGCRQFQKLSSNRICWLPHY